MKAVYGESFEVQSRGEDLELAPVGRSDKGRGDAASPKHPYRLRNDHIRKPDHSFYLRPIV